MRSYADFLGLDGQLYVDEYNSRHVSDGFLDEQPPHRPRAHRDRSIEKKVVLLALAGIAARDRARHRGVEVRRQRLRRAEGADTVVAEDRCRRGCSSSA